jgi:hypothetical protein
VRNSAGGGTSAIRRTDLPQFSTVLLIKSTTIKQCRKTDLYIVFNAVISLAQDVILEIELEYLEIGCQQCRRSECTIENPMDMSFTKADILRGSSKLPRVTALIAKRD